MFDDSSGTQGVLACRAVSAAEAVRRLDAAERTYERVVRQARGDQAIIAACERMMIRWANRNVHLLPKERYRATLEKLAARKIFHLGTLSRITRFVSEVDPIPTPLAEGWALAGDFQPMCELRMLETDIGPLWHLGIRAGDRLFVHLGSIAYRGALVIVSCRVTQEGGRRTTRHFAARILEFEAEEHGPVLRVGEGAEGLMLATSGAITVECVVFNRPDVLSGTR